MKVAFLALSLLGVATSHAQAVRLWFAYGDESTAELARVSGIDTAATVGREIQPGRLATPLSGRSFKLQLWCQLTNPTGQSVFTGGPTMNIAFDRTFCGDANQNPPLNEDSFRKVRPAGANSENYVEAFTNGAIVPGWFNQNTIDDWDNDGVQDLAQIRYLQTNPSAWRQGVQGDGETLRSVGLASFLRPRLLGPANAGGGTGFKLPNATPFRIIDVNWVSMLNLGETYGDREGETGLSITTSPVIGLANTTAIVDGTHTGSRYTLVAVAPEPGAGVAFGIGALLLLRRRVKGEEWLVVSGEFKVRAERCDPDPNQHDP